MSTLRPRDFKRRASEAAVIPLPSDETTPPVTKMYLVIPPPLSAFSLVHPLLPRIEEVVGSYRFFPGLHFRHDLLHFPYILRTIDGAGFLRYDRHLNRTPVFQHPQLLQALRLFQSRGRQRGESEKKRPAKS